MTQPPDYVTAQAIAAKHTAWTAAPQPVVDEKEHHQVSRNQGDEHDSAGQLLQETPTAGGLPRRYLTPADLAGVLDVPLETVYQWRRKHTGPPGFRVGRHLRFDPARVRQWIDTRTEGA